MSDNNENIAKEMRRLARDLEQEAESNFGKLKSKTWSNKKTNKQERRENKNQLRKMAESGEFSLEEDK
jgi:hypothetical protein